MCVCLDLDGGVTVPFHGEQYKAEMLIFQRLMNSDLH